ncbi:MAG: hypothetical protein N3E37_02520 [Candidatus Micrarchaeota archaeon]|nr:hypothetical protein [Candidatus Micrarchaeota archaeon]
MIEVELMEEREVNELVMAVQDAMMKRLQSSLKNLDLKDVRRYDVGGRCLNLPISNSTNQLHVPITKDMYDRYVARMNEIRQGIKRGIQIVRPINFLPPYSNILNNLLSIPENHLINSFFKVVQDQSGNNQYYLTLTFTDLGIRKSDFFMRLSNDSAAFLALLGVRYDDFMKYGPCITVSAASTQYRNIRREVARMLFDARRRPEYYNLDNNLFGTVEAFDKIRPAKAEEVAGTLSSLHNLALANLNRQHMSYYLRDNYARLLLEEMAARARYFTRLMRRQNASQEEKKMASNALDELASDYNLLASIFSRNRNFHNDPSYKRIRERYLDSLGNPINRPQGMQSHLPQSTVRSNNKIVT